MAPGVLIKCGPQMRGTINGLSLTLRKSDPSENKALKHKQATARKRNQTSQHPQADQQANRPTSQQTKATITLPKNEEEKE